MSLGTAPTQNTLAHGPALMQRLDALARFSEDPDRLTRTFLSPAHRQAADQVLAWMREAGHGGADRRRRQCRRPL